MRKLFIAIITVCSCCGMTSFHAAPLRSALIKQSYAGPMEHLWSTTEVMVRDLYRNFRKRNQNT